MLSIRFINFSSRKGKISSNGYFDSMIKLHDGNEMHFNLTKQSCCHGPASQNSFIRPCSWNKEIENKPISLEYQFENTMH